MYALKNLCHDNEVPLWNYPHLLKLSIRHAVQLMKLPRSKPFLSRTQLSFWDNSFRAMNTGQHFSIIVWTVLHTFLHRVNYLVRETCKEKPCCKLNSVNLHCLLTYTEGTAARNAQLQMHHKSFNKAYMEIAKQIIKGAHEMGKYCTVHSRGVARKRYCWVSQWAIHRLWEERQ